LRYLGCQILVLVAASCGGSSSPASSPTGGDPGAGTPPGQPSATPPGAAQLPLVKVGDVDLPGAAVRFDYQDIDPAKGRLVIAHMNDASVVVADLKDGSTLKVLPNVPTARGIVVADDVGRFLVTSSPNQLVIFDNATLAEIGRVSTGRSPDGVGWDPAHKVVGVSDQGDGAISLIPDSGNGTRVQLKLGTETGNVVYDAARAVFWISVVAAQPPDQLVAVDPVSGMATTHVDLPGCQGAHGLRIHPDGQSALVACEGNDVLARVDLGGAHGIVTAATGSGPDVLSVDPGLGWIYVAAESGDLVVFDVGKPGLTKIDAEHVADNAHSVAVDPTTHRVFFPLLAGPKGTPALRIMKPAGV
jgi:DNA-binding beta-propeller fold protein YncE